jgi:hypothetical protein
MDDDKLNRPADDQPGPGDPDAPKPDDAPAEEGGVRGPAPWERGETREAPDVDATSEGEASYLADDQMSLSSKIRGGGRDLGGEAPGENVRLCPACGRVTSFIDDTCTNCKHKLGSGGFEDVQQLRGLATGATELPITRILLIALIALIVLAILFIGLPRLLNRPTAPAGGEQPQLATSPGDSSNFVGELREVEITPEFKDELAEAIEAGNSGWANAGLYCYVYRISLLNSVTPAVSQTILVTAFVGGDDHAEGTAGAGEVEFRTGIAPFLDEINSRPGVDLSVVLEYTGGEQPPAREDIYLRYGYYYGKEHWHEFEPIIEALEVEKFNEKEYPGQLRQNMIPASLNTRGGLFFMPEGIGYMPIYEEDSSGRIIMGSGSGIESFKPANCTGYYIVKYTRREDQGLDLFSDEELTYYIERIAPFPYDPRGPVRNMDWEPDGKADGIACVIKNGVLQE